jgi:hypothetical protein
LKNPVRFNLNAPGLEFVGFRAKTRSIVLDGKFDGARFSKSGIAVLTLLSGSFRNLDLTDAVIERLNLRLDGTDLSGLKLPRLVKTIFLRSCAKFNDFRLQVAIDEAAAVVAAWNSPRQCTLLAAEFLGREPSLSARKKRRMLRSRAVIARNLLGACAPQVIGGLAVALLLRKNELRKLACHLRPENKVVS